MQVNTTGQETRSVGHPAADSLTAMDISMHGPSENMVRVPELH